MSYEKSILVTGGAGFIGSNFLQLMVKKYPNSQFINVDSMTYAANLKNLDGLIDASNYEFIEMDILSLDKLNEIFERFNITDVIHFAAESHVDNSIAGPKPFFYTNVIGTMNLVETSRIHWMNEPFSFKKGCESNRFHHISTDEVFGELEDNGYFTEETPYAPNSPYSASKAGSDFVVRSYEKTFGMNIVTTNCSNNYGPRQHKEKLIPTIIRKAIAGEKIPVYGNGENIRDWLYVEDHCNAIELVFHEGRKGETYCVGGNNEMKNIDVVREICLFLDIVRPRNFQQSYIGQIEFVKDRAGHDWRYAIDCSKIKRDLGWTPKHSFSKSIRETVHWYLENL
ncbi:dTDP-glucose 4,6-dehydratase [Bacteriovoracaceae bacterium]|nr:dTDP-glucose 4,6-dehydratase [Bacteriovoracaceae bacterium]